MKPKDWFGVLVRAIGVVLAAFSLWFLCYAAELLLGLPGESPHEHVDNLVSGLVAAVVAAYLIRGAPHLVRFAYPAQKEDSDEGQPPRTIDSPPL